MDLSRGLGDVYKRQVVNWVTHPEDSRVPKRPARSYGIIRPWKIQYRSWSST
jgi:hypothetical protein